MGRKRQAPKPRPYEILDNLRIGVAVDFKFRTVEERKKKSKRVYQYNCGHGVAHEWFVHECGSKVDHRKLWVVKVTIKERKNEHGKEGWKGKYLPPEEDQ